MVCTPFWQDEWGKNTALCCARSSFPLRSLVVPASAHAVLLCGAAGCPAELRRGLGVRPRCLKGADTPRIRGTAERLSSSSQVSQLCPTLCDPLGSTVCGVLQARILEWVASLFSLGSSQPRDQTQASRIAGRFFSSWAAREGLRVTYLEAKITSRAQKQLNLLPRCNGWK